MAMKCHSTQAPLGSETTGKKTIEQLGGRPRSPTAYREEIPIVRMINWTIASTYQCMPLTIQYW